ncbi:MAG: hypothetical protein IKY83_01295, partial [Proteobacteria bacterium]|nr:hypothetical protein [Pseudomonadota bacterium]
LKSLLFASSFLFLMSSCDFGTGFFFDNEYEDENPEQGQNTPSGTGNQTKPDTIPFNRVPKIPDYKLPEETFADDLEKEASEIIDHAIEKAIAYVSVMKDSRHSSVSYPYDEDAEGYISALDTEELEIFRDIVSAAKAGQPFSISESEYDGELMGAYFHISEALNFVTPDLSSYVKLTGDMYVTGDLVSHYRDLHLVYYDPYYNPNKTVAKGDVTQDEVNHSAALLDRVVKRVVRFMPEGLSTYDKYYYLAAVLSEQTDYDYDLFNEDTGISITAFNALISRTAVCQGYAAAYALLCKEANLWVGYKGGHARGEGHAWNLIKLEDGIYNVDVTWSDGAGKPYLIEWYDYFIKSDELFEDNGHEQMTGLASTGTYAPCPYEE